MSGAPSCTLLATGPPASAETCRDSTKPSRFHSRALVIEDQRMACADLRHRGYLCDRITHQEVMAQSGTKFLGDFLAGDYHVLWITTPADWYVRVPGKRATSHWDRIRNYLVKAKALRMRVVLFGPPGHMWKIAPMRDSIEDLRLQVVRMRL